MNRRFSIVIGLLILFILSVVSCVTEKDFSAEDDISKNWISGVTAYRDGGYLFAFLTTTEYYRIHYSISRDGYNWQVLNRGKTITDEYRGHPDICLGGDGIYRMIGVFPTTLWESTDLIYWERRDLPDGVFERSNEFGYYTVGDLGAPKMYYDEDSKQYIITWHACKTPDNNDWDSMQTLYMITSDFKDFSKPDFLFNLSGYDEDICTIDNIIRQFNGSYYAIVKDERAEYNYPKTGKTIRYSKADNLTGPYSHLSNPITPVGWVVEAPIVVQLPNDTGVALYVEMCYDGLQGYKMFVSDSIEGEWEEKEFNPPIGYGGVAARHGCIVKVPENIYQNLIKQYQ